MVFVTVLGLVGGAWVGGGTPRADSSAAGAGLERGPRLHLRRTGFMLRVFGSKQLQKLHIACAHQVPTLFYQQVSLSTETLRTTSHHPEPYQSVQ